MSPVLDIVSVIDEFSLQTDQGRFLAGKDFGLMTQGRKGGSGLGQITPGRALSSELE